jgi:hypothetical protein
MATLSALSVEQQVFAGVSLASAFCGVLGSLFFAYDLLGRPGGPLRLLLRLLIPMLLGGLLVGSLDALLFLFEGTLTLPSYQYVVLEVVFLGALLGTYNGLFVDAPAEAYPQRFPFSPRDAFVGLLVAAGFLGLELSVNGATTAVPLRIATGGVAGGILAGFWRVTHHQQVTAPARPPLVSWASILIGLLAGFVLVLAVLLGIAVPGHGMTVRVVGSAAAFAVTVGFPAGGIAGALTPYVFWRVNALGEKGMQVLGLALILLAFCLQVVEPIAQLVGS